MKMHVSFVAVALACCATRVAAQSRQTLVFYDDFSSGTISPDKWTHDVAAVGIGKVNFQMVSPEQRNSNVTDGVMYIRPTLTVDRFPGRDILNTGTIDVKQLWGRCVPSWSRCVTQGTQNRPIITANLRSTGTIKYGRVEVVAKMPKGDWLWPAIWMMPKKSTYGTHPRSGEIDIIEAAGNLHYTDWNGKSVGIDRMVSTIHYGNESAGVGHKQPRKKYWLPEGTTFADNFHTFWLNWTKDYMKIGVDKETVLTLNTPETSFWQDGGFTGENIWASGGKNAPFDQEFYLILGVGVGGGFFHDGLVNKAYPRPWSSGDVNGHRDFWKAKDLWYPTWRGADAAMKIKSVKMWQYNM